MADDILNETVAWEDLKKYEREYHDQLSKLGTNVSRETKFNYAWCLVRSRYSPDIRKGIILFEELFQSADDEPGNGDSKRDYMYYLALGNARIKEYVSALRFTRAFLNLEPGNQQVASLESSIRKKMGSEGLKGMALLGGVALAIGGIVGLGLALAKKK